MITALCGVCQSAAGSWAVVACALHPEGVVRHAVVAPAAADGSGFGARAGDVLSGSTSELCLRFDDGSWLDARVRPRMLWPRRAFGALGPAHLIPRLGQYWHPVVLAADVAAEGQIGSGAVRLHGGSAYLEKNWGPGFAGHWWWGHADAFAGVDASVAFAGGPLRFAGTDVAATAAVLRVGERLWRFAPPLARVRVRVSGRGWRVSARSARHSLELEGAPGPGDGHLLPVPDVERRRVEMRSRHHLAGVLSMTLRRGTTTLIEDVSPLAGLELGLAGDVER